MVEFILDDNNGRISGNYITSEKKEITRPVNNVHELNIVF